MSKVMKSTKKKYKKSSKKTIKRNSKKSIKTSKKKSKSKYSKVASKKNKVVKPAVLVVDTVLKNMLDWVNTSDLITHLTTHSLNKDIWQAEWETGDRQHYLETQRNSRFHLLSKKQKTKMKKELKYWENRLSQLKTIQKTLQEANTSYQKLCRP